jgi:hypothetical protein
MSITAVAASETPVSEAQVLVERLIKLAEAFPGQPVAVVYDDEGLQIGVMNLLNPNDEDWCIKPVPLNQLTRPVSQT